MAVSFAVEALAILVVVLVSLVTVDGLGAISLHPMPPLPRATKAVHIVASEQTRFTSATHPRLSVPRFHAPVRTPTDLPRIEDRSETMLADLPGMANAATEGNPNGLPDAGPLSRTQAQQPLPPPPAAEVRPKEPTLIRVGGVVLEANLVKRILPVYPPLARQMRIAGTVSLEGIIARDGRVINLRVVSGHPLLTQAAVEAVRQWVYRPTLLNGHPVEVIAPIEVHFTLSQ